MPQFSGIIKDAQSADFKDAIIDDDRLSKYLSERKAKNVPLAVKSKKELKEKLEKSGLSSSLVQEALSHSILE
jgi:hypothetical protein